MKTAFIAALLLAASASAQTPFTDPANLRGERVNPRTGRELPIDEGARGLEQMLRKLNTRASLMLIVAHPDDEDGGLLTLYSRGLGARVADLSLTRGEGGQNAVTGDFEDALGLIRTQELLSSDRYTGVDQFFGTEVDFGFSKTKEEAFAKWTHQRVLYDAVRAVRLYRPLVIAAVFIGGVTDGHGQHQVSGEIAQEVFKAAGDPTVFPELTAEGILPWQPLKVYARVPTQSITTQGLFDYATGQYAPARFTNYVTGEVTTTAPSVDVVIHEGQTDPLLTNSAANPADLRDKSADPNAKLSYVQFARIGLGLQKTQIGPGVRLAAPGAFDIGYHLYGSRLTPYTDVSSRPERSAVERPAVLSVATHFHASKQDAETAAFFDGIDTSLEGIASLASSNPALLTPTLKKLQQLISTATIQFQPNQPNKIAPTLAEALHSVQQLIPDVEKAALPSIEKNNVLHELRIKAVQLNHALILALGIQSEAVLEPALQTAEHPLFKLEPVSTNVPLRSTVHILSRFDHGASASDTNGELGTNRLKIIEINRQIGPDHVHAPGGPGWVEDVGTNRPYFARLSIEQPYYDLIDPSLRNAPQTPPHLFMHSNVDYHGITVEAETTVNSATRLPSGELDTQPVNFVPQVSVNARPAAMVSPSNSSIEFAAEITTSPNVTAALTLQTDAKPNVDSDAVSVATGTDGRAAHTFHLHRPSPLIQTEVFHILAKTATGKTYTESFRSVGYPGLIYTNFYQPATTRVVPVDLNLPTHRRIAYLPGTGDAIPEALASIGLTVSTLAVSDLTPEHLAQFDTVILGVRTYNAHPDLHGAPTQALLDFARSGGNVVVQYQTPEFTGADAPYPLSIGNAEKVVDETAAVKLLQPTAAVFTAPNRITSADFNGWIEERGHDFLQSWDQRYTALTETHDPGQAPQEGGLITTPLGRGHWTYCAFALYRQLPEAVPGAFRVFVNLLGLADDSKAA